MSNVAKLRYEIDGKHIEPSVLLFFARETLNFTQNWLVDVDVDVVDLGKLNDTNLAATIVYPLFLSSRLRHPKTR